MLPGPPSDPDRADFSPAPGESRALLRRADFCTPCLHKSGRLPAVGRVSHRQEPSPGGKKSGRSRVWWSYASEIATHTGDTMGYRK